MNEWGVIVVVGFVICFFILHVFLKIRNKKDEQTEFSLMTPDEKSEYILKQKSEFLLQQQKQLKKEALNLKVQELRKKSQEQRTVNQYGQINPVMVCPHCQTTGLIRTINITHKAGVSGAKATASILTGGLSLLVVGLSRKEEATQAHCDSCNNTWLF